MATENRIKRFLAEHANPIVVAIGLIGIVFVVMQGETQTQIRIERVDARIDEMGARLDARIDEMGARLDARIDASNASLNARIDETNRRIDGVQNTLVEISGKIDRLISVVEIRNERFDARLAALEKTVETQTPAPSEPAASSDRTSE